MDENNLKSNFNGLYYFLIFIFISNIAIFLKACQIYDLLLKQIK
jgi:hypothetical protein